MHFIAISASLEIVLGTSSNSNSSKSSSCSSSNSCRRMFRNNLLNERGIIRGSYVIFKILSIHYFSTLYNDEYYFPDVVMAAECGWETVTFYQMSSN